MMIPINILSQKDFKTLYQSQGSANTDHDSETSSRKHFLSWKEKMNSKKGRLIVRNVSYKADENAIRDLFRPFGEINEVSILMYPNGLRKGPVFVEFKDPACATNAIQECNMKSFMNRPIAVDFAVPAVRYQKNQTAKKETVDIKQEDLVKSNIEDTKKDISSIKIEEESSFRNDDRNNYEDRNDDDEIQNDFNLSEEEEEEKEMDYEDEEEKDFEGSNESDKKYHYKKKMEHKPEFQRKEVSKDVEEKRSLFLRNIPFDANEKEVEEILQEFGPLKYVVFCRNKVTNYPKGTAFAQYMSKESCDACLVAFDNPLLKTNFQLRGHKLIVMRALGRGELQQKMTEEKNKKTKMKEVPQDKRNLYLSREGVIREGTLPAKNVSKSDLKIRMQRELTKRRMLANLNIFVSPVRVFVCNLPLELTDKELKAIFKKHSPKDAVITECKIMRNLFELNDQQKPVSKGFGFVTFSEHSHALVALRNINNNPNIFTAQKRPIVEFSMENRAALEAKKRRLDKSKQNLNLDQKPVKSFLGSTPTPTTTTTTTSSQCEETEEDSFRGSKYNPKIGGQKALRARIGPKIRHKDRNKKPGKITRNQLNNKLRSSRDVKRKRGSLTPKGQKSNKKTKKSNKEVPGKKGKLKRRKFI